MTSHTVLIRPQNINIKVFEQQSLFDAIRSNNIYIRTICGGHANCGQCVVKIMEGVENLNQLTFEEKALLGNVFHITKERLACQTYVKGENVVIDMSDHNEDEDKKNKKNVSTYKPSVKRKSKEQVEKEKKEKNKEYRKKQEEKEALRPGGMRRPKAFKTNDKKRED